MARSTWTPEEVDKLGVLDREIAKPDLLTAFREHVAAGAFREGCVCTACTYARIFNWPTKERP